MFRPCLILAALALFSPVGVPAEDGAIGMMEWPVYGGDNANRQYSSLDQINAENVKDLQIAWRWNSLDDTIEPKIRTYRFEATPIMVRGVLYTSLSSSRVVALDPKTGRQLWVFDPKVSEFVRRPTNLGFVHRGVAYWTDGAEERIFVAALSSHLYALDAKTGQPIPTFGEGGRIDMTKGMRRPVDRNSYTVTSPPTVCRDVVTVGSSIFDGPTRQEMPPGDVRGWDVRTGKELWNFHTIAQPGEFGHETWEEDGWKLTGNANVWSIIAADDELGYFYLPIGTPTNDWYGGHRKGDGLFAESIVCLEAKTGKRVWHFQMVHHGVWDYDPPAAPTLCDITVDGKKIKAVAQVTNQGFCYVFDRATGEPVWPIEERPVPQSDVEGEKTSPTQPFPTKPPPFERQGTTEDDLIDFTPELRAEALEIVKKFKIGPVFTPPSEQGTINMPGWQGGANWGGAAFDPDTGFLYVPSLTDPIVVKLGKPDPARSDFKYVRVGGMKVPGPKGGTNAELPLYKPPYGRITAYDMNKGDIAWQVANGKGPKDHPAIKHLNLPDLGNAQRSGVLLTKTLLFVPESAGGMGGGGGGGEPQFRAFDKATGKIVHEMGLPASAGGTPMTYMVGGKQYIVVAVGGGAKPQDLIALSLP
jgi:quinoprotein glucose dehydrogenase